MSKRRVRLVVLCEDAMSQRRPPPRRSSQVRCRLCGEVVPGWLPIQNRPAGDILQYHLSTCHPAEARAYGDRVLDTKDLGPIFMEAFERVEGP
jgi:hypothetical protein